MKTFFFKKSLEPRLSNFKKIYLEYKNKNKILNFKGGNTKIPKIIYMFWHDTTKMPFFVRRCMHNIKTKNPDYKVKLYNFNDVMKIKNKPKIFEKYGKNEYIIMEEYRIIADWLRLYLLKTNGGIWMDISCIFNKKSLNDIVDLNSEKLQGFLPPWDDSAEIIENWFLAAKKNNLLIEYWFKEWEIALLNKKEYSKQNLNYATQSLKPFLPYLTQHLTFLKIIKLNNLQNLFQSLGYSNAKNNPFDYHEKFNWKIKKLCKFLLTTKKLNDDLLFIKLRGSERMLVINSIKKCKFSKNSQIVRDLHIKCIKT